MKRLKLGRKGGGDCNLWEYWRAKLAALAAEMSNQLCGRAAVGHLKSQSRRSK